MTAVDAVGAPARRVAVPAPVVVALGAALAAGAAAAVATFAVPGERDATPMDVVWLVSWLSFAVVGALVLVQRPGHPAGRAFLAVGSVVPVAGLVDVLTFWAADRVGDEASAVVGLRLAQQVLFTAGMSLVLLLPLLLPDGVLARSWMRWPATAARAGAVVNVLVSLLAPGPIGEDLPLDNPLGVPAPGLFDALEPVATVVLLLGAGVGVLSLVLRARGATGTTRAQLAWLAFGALVVVGVNVLGALVQALGVDVPETVATLLVVLTLPVVPVCVAVAVLRHNLLDIELLLRRSLVYAVLSAGVLLAYLGLAALLGSTVDRAGPSALLGGLVAVAALPLRTAGQHWLDRRFYGTSGDPYAVLSGLTRQLSDAVAPEQVPAEVAASVVAALRVPWAGVELDGDLLAAAGSRPSWEPTVLPLVLGSGDVGRLLVAPRHPHEPLEERDLRLLRDLAGQVALALDGLRLTRELQRSREALVLAREEERRRLRNDLHDGLGPVLAGVALQLGVVRDQADGRVGDVLESAQQRLGGAVEDLRRLVYGLRPPALDELGLEGAVRAHLASYEGSDLALLLDLRALPPLPAALEVAAYRVVTEAVTNVLRHAAATTCAVRLAVDADDLLVEVTDDGTGVRGPAGIGLASMVTRCAEVGGSCEVTGAAGGGTSVTARLPLGVAGG